MQFTDLETFRDIGQLRHLAGAAERAGYDGFAMPDSTVSERDQYYVSITPQNKLVGGMH